MKKILIGFGILCLFSVSFTQAFFWSKNSREKNSDDSPKTKYVFVDPFFSFHSSFFDDDFWNFPKINFANTRFFSSPAIDLKQKDDDTLLAVVDVLNYEPENISVEIKNKRWLVIKGEKSSDEEKSEDSEKYYYRERNQQASFLRTMLLPFAVDKSKVEAKFDDEVLTITMPKSEENNDEDDKIEIKID